MNHVRTLLSKTMHTDISRASSDVELDKTPLTNEDKVARVLKDPKFGMFSLMSVCNDRKSEYCSRTFATILALPVCVFVAQWFMFVGFVVHRLHNHGEWCPMQSTLDGKLVMVGIALLYFVNSFFQWDSVLSRRVQGRVFPSDNVLVVMDTWHEFSFSLCVYVANLMIVYTTQDVSDMLFNSLAMEFVHSLDNEFERAFFSFHPQLGVEIYDTYFVTPAESRELRKRKGWMFRCCLCPFKILNVCFMLLPVFCAFMVIFGAVCR